MTLDILLHIIFRFIHIGSVIFFLGGVTYAGLVFLPAMQGFPEETASEAAAVAQRRFRNTLYPLLTLIVLSGLYNYFSYSGPRHSSAYQIWFGIKFLLFLHVLTTAILWATSPLNNRASLDKSKRRLLSMTGSGLLIVLISAYLRSLTQRGL